MHLISSLNAGFAAAPLGHAEIYVRGSSTRATWYASLEGDGANSTGANITLDAQGSALVYVNQLVDVVVKDVDGVSVRSFGDGVAAPNVEVRSTAFTGIDYDTAASAAGNPTNLKAMADLWLAKNGAIDWQVLFNGAATTIQNALSVMSGVFFNVKTYGSVGDGVASDQAAFTAAVAAAVAAGGGNVYVPPGTHRLTAGLTWDARVNLVGIPGKSIITMDHATERLLTFSSASSALMPCLFFGITFQTAQTNSATVVRLDEATRLRCVACTFNDSATSIGIAVQVNTTSSCSLEAVNCLFKIQSTTLGSLTCAANHTSKINFTGCRWILPATFSGDCINARSSVEATPELMVSGCSFDATTNITAGAFYAVRAQNGYITLTDNRADSAFARMFALVPTGLSVVRAQGNTVNSGTAFVPQQLYSVTGDLSTGSALETPGVIRTTIGAIATAADAHQLIEYVGNSTDPTITMPALLFPGQRLSITFLNSSGGAWAVGPAFTGAVVVTGVTIPNVANGSSAHFEFIVEDLAAAGTYVWRLVYAVG